MCIRDSVIAGRWVGVLRGESVLDERDGAAGLFSQTAAQRLIFIDCTNDPTAAVVVDNEPARMIIRNEHETLNRGAICRIDRLVQHTMHLGAWSIQSLQELSETTSFLHGHLMQAFGTWGCPHLCQKRCRWDIQGHLTTLLKRDAHNLLENTHSGYASIAAHPGFIFI